MIDDDEEILRKARLADAKIAQLIAEEGAAKRQELIRGWVARWRVPYTQGGLLALEEMMVAYAEWERSRR